MQQSTGDRRGGGERGQEETQVRMTRGGDKRRPNRLTHRANSICGCSLDPPRGGVAHVENRPPSAPDRGGLQVLHTNCDCSVLHYHSVTATNISNWTDVGRCFIIALMFPDA